MTYTQFIASVNEDTTLVIKFEKYLSKSGFEVDLSSNKDIVKKNIVAEFVRQLFSDEQSFQILLKEDPMIKAVLK
jgi:carboxyl-terminal processing protease